MTNNTQRLLGEALRLPESERADLATELLLSLDPEVDDDAEQLWQEEIIRRVAELDSGAVKTIPWSEVRASLLGRLNGDSPR